MSKSMLCALACFVVSGCPKPKDECPTLTTKDRCPVHTCGNAARVYKSIVEALDTRGLETQTLDEPFLLARGSLEGAGGGCAKIANLSLGIVDGALVGVSGPADAEVERCRDKALEGARFKLVQQLKSREKKPVWVRIESVGEVTTWAAPAVTLPTYELVAEEEDKSNKKNLCESAAWDHSLAGIEVLLKDRGETKHALVVQGETYGADATVRKTGPHWFNIACAGSGMSKMRLLGEHSQASHSSPNKRVATLKMLTAKYCGEKSMTRDNVQILIRVPGDSTPGDPSDHVGPIESVWNEKGAMCITDLRLWQKGSDCAKRDERKVLDQIRTACGIKACEPASCTSVPAGSGHWSTCTTKHIHD